MAALAGTLVLERLVAVRRHPVLRDRHLEVLQLGLPRLEELWQELPGDPGRWSGLSWPCGWIALDCEPSLAVAEPGHLRLRALDLRCPHSLSCWSHVGWEIFRENRYLDRSRCWGRVCGPLRPRKRFARVEECLWV